MNYLAPLSNEPGGLAWPKVANPGSFGLSSLVAKTVIDRSLSFRAIRLACLNTFVAASRTLRGNEAS